jgi:hypothetical protein
LSHPRRYEVSNPLPHFGINEPSLAPIRKAECCRRSGNGLGELHAHLMALARLQLL